ncbi:MAG: AMP-binding enzyme [Caulobacteraceae bacterium]
MTVSPSRIGTAVAPVALSLRARLQAGLRARADMPQLSDANCTLPLSAIAAHDWIDAPLPALAGRCVLVLTASQLGAVLALVSLDGVAARIVLCPPDLSPADLPDVIARAGVDAVVSDTSLPAIAPGLDLPRTRWFAITAFEGGAGPPRADAGLATEWVLFTSGTSGAPKMVTHTLQGLTGAIAPAARAPVPTIWGTFYDIRRYGGLQILLRALVGARSMVLAQAGESLDAHLQRLSAAGVTHQSGTPSHWRRVLMTPGLGAITPAYVRLSGEIADQGVLDSLAVAFPQAAIGHAYASTEAGVGFEVNDGRAGFPASLIDQADGAVRMRVMDGALQLSSTRTATRYVGQESLLVDGEGFVDSGDMVELRDGRYHFVGRRSGVVNVGGLKVHPEEIEAIINTRPGVRLSRVKGRRNPITGAIIEAEVVLADSGSDSAGVRQDILDHCRAVLPPFKTPTSIRFVETLPLTAGGKLERPLA